jgi:hypothetical protein
VPNDKYQLSIARSSINGSTSTDRIAILRLTGIVAAKKKKVSANKTVGNNLNAYQ